MLDHHLADDPGAALCCDLCCRHDVLACPLQQSIQVGPRARAVERKSVGHAGEPLWETDPSSEIRRLGISSAKSEPSRYISSGSNLSGWSRKTTVFPCPAA